MWREAACGARTTRANRSVDMDRQDVRSKIDACIFG